MNNFYGANVLALVWSFSNEYKDIPYRISLISKKYSCNCPAFVHRRNCKHLITFREGMSSGTILNDKRYNVSDIGKEIIEKK